MIGTRKQSEKKERIGDTIVMTSAIYPPPNVFALAITDPETRMMQTYYSLLEWIPKKEIGVYRSICHIPKQFLNNGRFVFNMTIFEENYSNPKDFRDLFSFLLEDAPSVREDYFGGLLGSVRPRLIWKTMKVSDNGSQ